MTLHHVMYYVTIVTCLFIIQEIKEKIRENKKRNQIKENRQKKKKIKIKYKSSSIP